MKDKMYLISEGELVDLMEKALKCEVVNKVLNGDVLNIHPTYYEITQDTLKDVLDDYLEKTPFGTFKAMAYADIACHFEEAT